MVNVGQEVIVRGVVEESVPWGTVSNVRVRMPDGNDIWLSDAILEEMNADDMDGAKRLADQSPEHIQRDGIERMFDEMGQKGELHPEVSDYLKRRLLLGSERAGPAPKQMQSADQSGDRPKYAPGTAANKSGQPPSELREREKLAAAADVSREPHYSSPGRSARDMGKVDEPSVPQAPADAHTADTGDAVAHPRTEEEREADPGTATPDKIERAKQGKQDKK